jgi:hypothetical protein
MVRARKISAPISNETEDLLEQHDLPPDVLAPPRLVLSRRSFEQVAERLRSPGQPTRALRDLMTPDRD